MTRISSVRCFGAAASGAVISGWLVLCVAMPPVFWAAPLHASNEVTSPAVSSLETGGEGKKPHPKSLSGTYLSGRFARNSGDMFTAAQYLHDALKRDPSKLELVGESFRLQLMTGRVDEAADLAGQLVKLVDADPLVTMARVAQSVRAGRYDEAAKRLNMRMDGGIYGILVPLLSGWLDVGGGALKHPITLDEATESVRGLAPFVYYQLALMNDVAGFSDQALEFYQKALNRASSMPFRIVEMLGNFHERRGEKAKALSLYGEYRAANPQSFLLEDATPERGMGEDPADAVAGQVRPAPLVADAASGVAELFYTLAGILHNEENSEGAMQYLQLALYLRPDFPNAQLMLADAMERAQEYDEALRLLSQINPQSPYARKARLRSAFVLDRMGKPKEALALLDRIASADPDHYEAWVTKGDVLRGNQRFAEAAKAYSEAIRRLGELKPSHWSLFYIRGVCLERAGDWQGSEQDFRRALELEPGQPDVLNYLGYSLLMMGRNAEEGRDMIERAVEQRPNDAHIVDSMGWALYLAGDFTSALEYLERAVDLASADAAANEHLGDVYWQLGRKTEARFQWERTLVFNPEPQQREAILKKLKFGLPAVTPLKDGGAVEPLLSDMPQEQESLPADDDEKPGAKNDGPADSAAPDVTLPPGMQGDAPLDASPDTPHHP